MHSQALKCVLDVVCVLIVFFPLVFLNSDAVVPFHRGFFCNDESLYYPHKDDTITDVAQYLTGAFVNLITMLIIETVRVRRSNLPTKQKISGFCYEMYSLLGVLMFGCCVSELIVIIIKLMVGRLRPHFMDVCNPDPTILQKFCDDKTYPVYVEDDICTGEFKITKLARLSFPSGHATFFSFTMLYVVLYLEARWPWKESKLLKPLLQLAAILVTIAAGLSRISDYKHHWSDVLAGFIQGSLTALIFVFFISNIFKPREPDDESSNLLTEQSNKIPRKYFSTDNSYQNLKSTDEQEQTLFTKLTDK